MTDHGMWDGKAGHRVISSFCFCFSSSCCLCHSRNQCSESPPAHEKNQRIPERKNEREGQTNARRPALRNRDRSVNKAALAPRARPHTRGETPPETVPGTYEIHVLVVDRASQPLCGCGGVDSRPSLALARVDLMCERTSEDSSGGDALIRRFEANFSTRSSVHRRQFRGFVITSRHLPCILCRNKQINQENPRSCKSR